MMKYARTIAVAALAVAALAGCSSATSTAQHQAASPPVTATTASPPATATASPVAVLAPGHSATFTIRSLYGGERATSLTWTIGKRVATAADPDKPGYESAGFQVTIRNNGPAATSGSPDYGSSLIWTGRDGRSDDTLASTAAAAYPFQLGLTGTEIAIQSSLPPGGYVKGYLMWEIPVAPGYVTLISGSADGMSTYPVLRVDY